VPKAEVVITRTALVALVREFEREWLVPEARAAFHLLREAVELRVETIRILHTDSDRTVQ
jgi:hypothetical protein